MDEFEVMRQQMAALKKELDTQHILNEELMHKVMRSKASWLNILVKVELFTLPFVFLLFYGICYLLDISQWYSFTFLIFGGIDAILDKRTVSIPNELFSSTSIIGIKKWLVRQKKERFIQTCIMTVISLAWLSLFLREVNHSLRSPLYESGSIWTDGFTFGIVGVCFVIIVILYQKMQRTNDKIMEDINRLESEGE